MQRLVLGLVAASVVVAAAFLSAPGRKPVVVSAGNAAPAVPNDAPSADSADQFQVTVDEKNPWTHLKLNKGQRDFQFAIVTDRTGGHRPGVFAKAIEKVNLLQPEFVMSVGDLIEGYTQDAGQWALEWSEFQGKVNKLQAPFFYVVGNHDISNPAMEANWDRKFGRRYYEFLYQNVLFVALSSEDPPGKQPRFSAAQRQWLQQTLDRNAKVRWTFVFLHKPAWLHSNVDATGWSEIERMLASRPHAVFAGHIHSYGRFVRNGGRDYIMLGTTGGGSKLRGKELGEIDHVVWVTMKETEPVIANLLLDGIEDKAFRTLPNTVQEDD